MKKLIQIFLFLLAATTLWAQDVIYTVSGDYNGGKTPLDSIIVDNITNGTSISFGDLPEHDYYQINLTKGAYWGTVNAFDLEESSIYKVIQNDPGFLSVRYGGTDETDAKVSILNVNGQTLYENDDLYLHPQNSLQVKLGSEGVYFVKIESSFETKTFKAIGSATRTDYDAEISDGALTEFVISPILKSTTLVGEGDFTFEEGDSIRIWAFKKDIYALPAHFKIENSEEVNFTFEELNDDFITEMAYPDSIGEEVKFLWDEDTMYCQKINGEFVYQGDIILTEEQIDTDLTKGATKRYLIKYWPDAKIYYEISDELEGDERINKALTYWNTNAPVIFEERTDEINYVYFVRREKNNSSFIGLNPITGKQKLKVADNASYGTILHEMGHAAGLIHEHSRSDRNDFVKIHRENIESGEKHNFNKNNISVNVGPFDFKSIMLYNMYTFSKNKEPTITKKDGSIYISQISYLSRGDIKILESIYGSNASKKPQVDIEYDYSLSKHELKITGNILEEGESIVTERAIAWKKTGDNNYNYKYFNEDTGTFSLTLNVECAEYIFYTMATNEYGTASSPIRSKTIPHYFYIDTVQITSSSVNLISNIDSENYVTGFAFGISSTSEGARNRDWDVYYNFIQKQADSFEVLVDNLEPNKNYFTRGFLFYEINDGETPSYGSEVFEFKTKANDSVETGILTDSRDGNIYKWVKIGEQVWMAENLAYLPAVSPDSSGSQTAKHYYVYGYQGTDVAAAKATDNYSTYGVLYNWAAAMDGSDSSSANPSGVRGVCPAGWHLPSDDEWKQLEMAIGMSQIEADDYKWRGTDEGTKLKAKNGWNNNGNGTDDFGFSALPGGLRKQVDGTFSYVGSQCVLWSSTERYVAGALVRTFVHVKSNIMRYSSVRTNGYYVRCVRD